MKKPKKTHRFHQRFRALSAMLLGVLWAMAFAAPTVDQSPLTIQSPIPPNIVLMLDDSGSMQWNFMPDPCASSGTTAYVNGVTCSGGNINAQSNNDALTNAQNNGVYYNPTVTYTPPIKVDGTSFPNSGTSGTPLTTAYADGFTNTGTAVDITQYAAVSTYSGSPNYYYTAKYDTEFNNVTNGYSDVAFSISTSAISATCASGAAVVNLGTYQSPNYSCATYNTQTPPCSTGTYSSSTGTCSAASSAPTGCPSGDISSGSGTSLTCTKTTSPTCPSSGNFSAGLCTLASKSCSSGSLTNVGTTSAPDWECVAPKTIQCPGSGSSYSSSTGLCTMNPGACSSGSLVNIGTTAAPNYECGTTTNPQCSVSGASYSSGTCTSAKLTSSNCPIGFTLSTSGSNKGLCVKSGQTSVNPTCPSSTYTTYTASTQTCSYTVGTSDCPSGYTGANSGSALVCYKLASSPLPSCSNGNYSYSTSTKLCAFVANANACPSGSTASGSGTTLTCTVQGAQPNCTTTTYSYSSSLSNASGGICTYTPTTCPSGYGLSGSGASLTCTAPDTPTCSSGVYTASSGSCVVASFTPSCTTGSLVNTGTATSPNYLCAGYTTGTATCPSGTNFSTTTGQCPVKTGGTAPATQYFFQYTTGPAAGPYTNYYVASKAQGCGNYNPHSSANCVREDDITGVAAPIGVAAGQNIANWFSYYRTRILTAKSGLTTAFNNLDPTVRLGFGSINGNNNTALSGTPYTTSGGTIKVAPVSAFDNSCVTNAASPCAKGQSGTQRASFWNWITSEKATGGTALRTAVDTVGQYYGTDAPWYTSSTDNTKLACRQAYLIATTDGFWNDSFTLSSPTNADNTKGAQITGPNGQSYLYTPLAPFSDGNSSTLADVAMKYWVTDLQPNVSNLVPTAPSDPAFWQHMTTFTLGLGFTPQGITPTGTTIDNIFSWANAIDSSIGTRVPTTNPVPANFAWPTPAGNSINNIADLAHAAVNGHGGFYSATSPQAFSNGIADALNRVASRNGTGASLAANSTKLAVGTVTYQAYYFSGTWSGDLMAYSVSSTTGAISTSANWKASAALPAWGSRKIYTYNGSQFVRFSSVSSLSTAQQNALGSTTTNQQNVLNYLLGDSSNETENNGVYRKRSTPLGDIIDSQPIYVGSPNPNLYAGQTFTGASDYSSFASAQVSRNPVIWVAANDGIVHGFEASDGAEVYGYLPGAVITNSLANLTSPLYGITSTVPHQSFNDGQMTVADVYNTSTSKWRTVLVGTTGHGSAKTVYALDVTDPSAPTPLWEKSASTTSPNSYIGQIASAPVIAQTANGTWSVLIGNGYNSSSGTAALLQFDVFTGALSVHTTNTTGSNGLSAPTTWIPNPVNGISTTAYAGDVLGNVWSFDLSSSTSAGGLLFTARDSANNAQPITSGMLAGRDPNTGNVWLFFGTGQYLTQSDLSSKATQTWYGLIVQSGTSSLVSNLANGRSALIQRKIIAEQAASSTTLAGRVITPDVTGNIGSNSGWYIDLLQPPTPTAQGERMVVPNAFQGNLLIGTTLIPQSSDPCNPSGSGWVMAINPFTGTNPFTGPNAPTGAKAFFDLNADGKFDASDQVSAVVTDPVTGQQTTRSYASAGVGFSAVPNSPIFVGNTMLTSFNNATNSSIATAGTTGAVKRLSWRELVPH